MTSRPALGIACLALLLTAHARAADPSPEGIEFFEKKVRPLLVERCQECHGPTKQRGGLRLDSRAAVLKGGDNGPALVPGDPGGSRMIRAVGYADVGLKMPPKTRLSDEQVADLTAWVKMGAPWPDTGPRVTTTGGAFPMAERLRHWCWQPIRATAPPSVRDAGWVRNPIDAFLLARLEATGLSPAPPADRRTLLRRVTFDLTGLPPTPEEIEAFLADDSPDAYEKVVDRLLASPAYGERWARHWMDLVRYAETLGHEFDFEIADAYQYRDYLVRAFNADLPYDQLVREHVAGDLLERPRRNADEGFDESILGTGFWFFGEAKHSPVDVRGDQADRVDNQIDVFAKTFLGLTLSCARCHDHKFDALTTKDYYALAGYLQSSRYQRAYIDDPEPRRNAARQIRQWQDEARKLAVTAVAKRAAERTADLAEHLLRGGSRQELRERLKKVAVHPPEDAPDGFVKFEDFSAPDYRGWYPAGEAFGDGPARATTLLQPNAATPIKEVLGPGVAHSGLTGGKFQGVLRSKTFTIEKNKILYRVAGFGGQVNLIIDGFQLIRDPIYGGLTFTVNHGDAFQWRVQDVSMWKGHRAYVEVIDDGPSYVAVDAILFGDGGPPADVPNALLMKPLDDPSLATDEALRKHFEGLFAEVIGQWRDGKLAEAKDAADRVALLNWLLPLVQGGEPTADLNAVTELTGRCQKLEAEVKLSRRAPAMADGSAVDERVHIRGSHKNLGDVVVRRLPEAVGGEPENCDGSGRLSLARRLTDPTNPLVARVMVNRVWMHHFGEGIVRSVDNFGALGQPPTHPELLDWLAAEFVRGDWSLKRLHRLMVTSSAYRMASRGDLATDEKDPKNELLHRMLIRRLEAEAVRDAMLAVHAGPRPAERLGATGRRRPAEPVRQRPPQLPDADVRGVRLPDAVHDHRQAERQQRAGPGADADEQPVRAAAGPAVGEARAGRARQDRVGPRAADVRNRVRPPADRRRTGGRPGVFAGAVEAVRQGRRPAGLGRPGSCTDERQGVHLRQLR